MFISTLLPGCRRTKKPFFLSATFLSCTCTASQVHSFSAMHQTLAGYRKIQDIFRNLSSSIPRLQRLESFRSGRLSCSPSDDALFPFRLPQPCPFCSYFVRGVERVRVPRNARPFSHRSKGGDPGGYGGEFHYLRLRRRRGCIPGHSFFGESVG